MEENKEPNLIDKAKSLSKAAVNWAVNDKFQRVSDEVFQQRKAICIACPYWKPEAYNNFGACGKCGCSVGKLYMPHSKCPDNPPRWIAVSVDQPITPTPTPLAPPPSIS
jgi:hypothetical protein